MSWTIGNRDPGSEEVQQLQEAITAAQKEKILMFGSASDEGPNRAETTYPGNCEGCFRIGAASNDGVRLPWVHPTNVQFLLPGKRIPFSNPDKESCLYRTGSSYATACATGLAGALLYCDRVLDCTYELHYMKNMSTVFDGLCDPKAKFVDAQRRLVGGFSTKLRDQDLESDLTKPLIWNKEANKALHSLLNDIVKAGK